MRPYVIHPYITRTLNPVPDWKRSKCVLAILQSCVESYHETVLGTIFAPFSCAISFSGTSPLGLLYSRGTPIQGTRARDTRFGPGEMFT